MAAAAAAGIDQTVDDLRMLAGCAIEPGYQPRRERFTGQTRFAIGRRGRVPASPAAKPDGAIGAEQGHAMGQARLPADVVVMRGLDPIGFLAILLGRGASRPSPVTSSWRSRRGRRLEGW